MYVYEIKSLHILKIEYLTLFIVVVNFNQLSYDAREDEGIVMIQLTVSRNSPQPFEVVINLMDITTTGNQNVQYVYVADIHNKYMTRVRGQRKLAMINPESEGRGVYHGKLLMIKDRGCMFVIFTY